MILRIGLLYMGQEQTNRGAVQVESSRGSCMGTCRGPVHSTFGFMWFKIDVDCCAFMITSNL